MSLSPDLPLHVLFASAAKHALDESVRAKRSAQAAGGTWRADYYVERSNALRLAAWSHLEAAREAKRRSAA